jgi:2-polyprenyl-3-methyl-5-hydroxy-6-metoxy-1,4-benzoquinol methylase
MTIRYIPFVGSWELVIEQMLSEARKAKAILDVGGGRYPAIPLEELNGAEYTVIDVSSEELSSTPAGYKKVLGDICTAKLEQKYDLVISKCVAEHVPDGEAFHRNIFRALVPGGVAWHFFPTLYCTPFVTNRLLPERLTNWILGLMYPHRKTWKFPAYYSWCRGPSIRQIERLEGIGYQIVDYTAIFGHNYWDFCPPLAKLNQQLASYLVRHPRPFFTAFSMITLRKPHRYPSVKAYRNLKRKL